jgi:hypothetical protein
MWAEVGGHNARKRSERGYHSRSKYPGYGCEVEGVQMTDNSKLDLAPAYERCIACRKSFRVNDNPYNYVSWCRACGAKYPVSLLRAADDCFGPFEYVLKLRDGELIHFETADLNGNFVHLSASVSLPAGGIDISVGEITWCRKAESK